MESTRAAARPNHLGIDLGAEGGCVVSHGFDNRGAGESWRQDEKHIFTDHAALMKHLHTVTAPHMTGTKAPAVATAPAASKQTGTGKAKASPPNQQTRGAGVD